MIKIDIIAPSVAIFKKFYRIPNPSDVKYLYWFPVWFYQKELKKLGLKVRFLNYFNLNHTKLSNIVGLDSREPYIIDNYIAIIKKLKKSSKFVIWFDQGDGPGKTFFPALRYVDRYYKGSYFKDLSLYNQKLYKLNLYSDYYFRNYSIKNYTHKPASDPLDPKYNHKIGLSWNFAYSEYRFSNILSQYVYGFFRYNTLKFNKPDKNRKLLFSANFNIMMNHLIIYYQRNELSKFLNKQYKNNENVSIGRVPKKRFLQNMSNSKAVFSPFGWGELCFRDFETFIAGAALIKPSMEHINTWPDLYKEYRTYIPIPWKVEEWNKVIPEILSDEDLLFKVAKIGQNLYRKVWSEEGKKEFCQRFIKMITPN